MILPDRIDAATAGPSPVRELRPTGTEAAPRPIQRTTDGRSFEDVLRTQVATAVRPLHAVPDPQAPDAASGSAPLRFSAHAQARLAQRGIELSQGQHARLEGAVDRAGAKGAKDALVLVDDTAMVVSVSNRTVITALGTAQARDNVFTNIDAAVIA